jgi:hypothetical protein
MKSSRLCRMIDDCAASSRMISCARDRAPTEVACDVSLD